MPDEQELIGEPLEEVPEREPGTYCNARKDEDGIFQGYCGAWAGAGTDRDEGRCQWHGGSGGGPEGEANGAYEHGAYSEHLRSDLTDREVDALEAAVDGLADPEGAQAIAREAAAEALLKYKRSADTRFLREFRQICKDFQIAPDDVLQVEGRIDHQHDHDVDLSPQQRAHLDALTEGPAEVDVEAVDDAS